MITTYKARLKGNRLDWQDEAPKQQSGDVAVLVTILQEAPLEACHSSGHRSIDILSRLANKPSMATIPDPVAWQKEQRQARDLPDRED